MSSSGAPPPTPGGGPAGQPLEKGKAPAGPKSTAPTPASSSLASSLFSSGQGILNDLASGLGCSGKASQFGSEPTSSSALESAQLYTPQAESSNNGAVALGAPASSAFRSAPATDASSSNNQANSDYTSFSTAIPASGPAYREAFGLDQHFDHLNLSNQPPGWEHTWASSAPPGPASQLGQPAFSQPGPRPTDADFLSLLEEDEQMHGAVPQGPLSNIPDRAARQPGASPHQPSRFLTRDVGLGRQHVVPEGYQPPDPTADVMSYEQAQVHLALDALQHSDDPDRVAERIEPPPDNEQLHQGVYALTEHDALREIIGGSGAIQHLNTNLERQAQLPTQDRQQQQGTSSSQWDRLRTYLPRGTYVDEVYNLPPLLAKTLAEAEEKPQEDDTQEDEDRRRTAIRRLDTLRQHLEPARPDTTAPAVVNVWDMEKFLKELDQTSR